MLRGITASALSSRERKVDSLQSAIGEIDGLQMLLLVLIGRQRTGITYNPEVSHLKLVGELYDKCQETLLQYVEFCQASLGFEGFELLKPTDDRNTWLVVTRWADQASFDAWVSSPGFAHGHRGADKPTESGAPVSVSAELWSYEVAGGSAG